MKKNLTELVFILDRSGSMGGLESDTIGGFNGMIEKQKKEDGEANVTTVLFDDRYDLVHDRFPIEHIKALTDRDYYVRGSTALLDAVGKTINKMANIQRRLPEELRAEKVIFVITTDGMENASTEYSYDDIKEMISLEKEKYGWEFMFLGANMDAVSEAAKFGISADRSATYLNDSDGVELNYCILNKAITSMRESPCMASIDGSWKNDIEEDFLRRGELK